MTQTLKRIKFDAEVIVRDGTVVSIYVRDELVNTPGTKFVALTKSAGDMAAWMFNRGDRVVVIDGCNISTWIGTQEGCTWTREKASFVGSVQVVAGVYPDGDVILVADESMYDTIGQGHVVYWSPAFLRLVPDVEALD